MNNDNYTSAEEYVACCEILTTVIPDTIPDPEWGLILARATMDMIVAATPDCPPEILAAREALPPVLA